MDLPLFPSSNAGARSSMTAIGPPFDRMRDRILVRISLRGRYGQYWLTCLPYDALLSTNPPFPVILCYQRHYYVTPITMPQTAPIYASFRHDPLLPILVKFSGCGLSNALWGWTGLVRWHGSSRMQEFMGSTWFLHLKDTLDQHQPMILCPRVRKRRAGPVESLLTAPLKLTTSTVDWIILQIRLISSMYDSSQSGLVLFFSCPHSQFSCAMAFDGPLSLLDACSLTYSLPFTI
jgi:hypothetical protein